MSSFCIRYVKRQRRQWLDLARHMRKGHVAAYPCEGVWGLGCDPHHPTAVQKVWRLKARSPQKGLILLTNSVASVWPFLSPKGKSQTLEASAYWPGPVTCLLDAHPATKRCLRGKHKSIAIRLSNFDPLPILAHAVGGAVVSTSANHAGGRAWNPWRFRNKVGNTYSILGPTGGRDRPSHIVDMADGRMIR